MSTDVMRQTYRKLTDTEVRQIRDVKRLGADFHTYLAMLGESRELALAKARLEEAVMWATKHLSG